MKIQSKPDYLIFADSAKKGENSDFPDVSRGWGITVDQTASKPPMEWMNGAFNRIDRNMLYLLQQGVPEWSELVKYPANAIIKYNGVLYTAIAENDNAKPSTDTTKWKKTQAEITGASTTQKGVVKLNSATNSTSETEAATPKAVKVAYDLANTAKSNAGNAQTKADSAYTLANTANTTANSAKSIAETDASTSKKGRIKLNSSTNSTSETEAATPLAVKKAFDNIEQMVSAITASSIGAITKNEADARYAQLKKIPELISNSFTGTLDKIGYQRLPSGLLIQWGSYSGSKKTFNFPVPFTKFCVVVRSGKSNGDLNYDLDISYTLTTFSVGNAYQHEIIAVGI